MKEFKIKLYTYNDLSHESQIEAVKSNYDINLTPGWDEEFKRLAKNSLKQSGFINPTVYYTIAGTVATTFNMSCDDIDVQQFLSFTTTNFVEIKKNIHQFRMKIKYENGQQTLQNTLAHSGVTELKELDKFVGFVQGYVKDFNRRAQENLNERIAKLCLGHAVATTLQEGNYYFSADGSVCIKI
jgi:hypothetical protein